MKRSQFFNIEGIKVLHKEQTKTIKGGAEDNMVCDWVGGVYICFDVIDVDG